MQQSCFCRIGFHTGHDNQKGVKGLRIQAVVHDLGFQDCVWRAQSKAGGNQRASLADLLRSWKECHILAVVQNLNNVGSLFHFSQEHATRAWMNFAIFCWRNGMGTDSQNIGDCIWR